MNISGAVSLARTAGLSLAEKGIVSAKVVLTGFVIVFAMLILLIFIIKIYSTIVSKAQQTGTKKSKKNAESKQDIQPKASASVVSAASAVDNGVSQEVVAIISAAVATMYGSPEKARIKSIKKSNGGRSSWANAGLLDNTRPF